MEMKASEVLQSPVRKKKPFQRFSLKQSMRSLKTVMRSCGESHSLQLLTACCMKMKKISRYELK